MTEQTSSIISKVWGMCNPLRDDGVSYGDYLEQLTYLIFLKMSYEYSKPPYNRASGIPAGYTWEDMNTLKGAELQDKYEEILDRLGDEGGILGRIFADASCKITKAAILYRIVQMIDSENWVAMSSDVKGDIYEGLLQKNAEDTKSGAGQYFTPRSVIQAMVACVRPEPNKTVMDPCCGSGGFLLAAQRFITENFSLDRDAKEFLKKEAFHGGELVRTTYKLALMNLYLHNIGDIYGDVPITRGDALIADPGDRYDYVLTNPPFGTKSSISFTNEDGEEEEEDLVYNRQDFWVSGCSNKQLNFIQHINTILKATGKAAVVVPDNVLFEGGAGETIRKKLLQVQLIQVEFLYLPLLSSSDSRNSSKTLNEAMAEDPAFFHRIISSAFLPEDKVRKQDIDENLAKNAFALLYHWKNVPGVDRNGDFNYQTFMHWYEQVMEYSKQSGHSKVAQLNIGKILFYVPSSEKLWINQDIAALLNEDDNKNLREGYYLESINSRGVRIVDFSGDDDYKLAAEYDKKAKELEALELVNFAQTLKYLAQNSKADAERCIADGQKRLEDEEL